MADKRSISKVCGSLSANSYLTDSIGQIQIGLIPLQVFGTYKLSNLVVGAQSDWRNLNITWRGGIPPAATIKHQDTGSVHCWAASALQVKQFLQPAIAGYPVIFNGVSLANQAEFDAAPLVAQDVDQDHTNILVPSVPPAVGAQSFPVSAAALRMSKIFSHSIGPSPAAIPTEFYFNSTVDFLCLYAFSSQTPIGQFIQSGDFSFTGVTATVSFNLERIA